MKHKMLETYTLIFIGKLNKDKTEVKKLIAGKYKDEIDYTGVSNPRDLYFLSDKEAKEWMKKNNVSMKNHCFVYKQVNVFVNTSIENDNNEIISIK